MKILHTSDWHLGHTLYGYDRSEEQNEMLRQIEELVGEERPDALVVSGDIFHTGQPSNLHSQKGIRMSVCASADKSGQMPVS